MKKDFEKFIIFDGQRPEGSPPTSRVMNPPNKPIPSPIRLIREDDLGPYCPECGSSMEFKLFFKPKGCVQPKCKNYCMNHNKRRLK